MPTIVDQETDARFWAQTHYRPGQKLDPSSPADAKMIPIWVNIRAKVQREYDAGTLKTTFDHPVAVQNIADAQAADQAGTASLAAVATAPDPATAQQHAATAVSAFDIVAQKLREVASAQPPQVSPQLAHEAAQSAQQDPPPPAAPAADHVAHQQTLGLGTAAVAPTHRPTPNSILDKETDARFWAQSHYKPGQRLDPSNPTDAKMIPVWRNIYAKVKAEDDAGRLVLTYNHPVVDQAIKDARVADAAAAAHLDQAASAPDAATAQANVAAASTAAQAASDKTREASVHQPPSVSPGLAHDAGNKVKRDPWAAPTGREQLAQQQAKDAGQRASDVHRDARHRRPPRSTVDPRRLAALRAQAVQAARRAGAPYVLVVLGPDGTPQFHTFRTRGELDQAYHQISAHHDQYGYVGAFDLQKSPNAPVVDSVGVPAAEHAEPPAAPAPEQPSAAQVAPPAEETTGWSTGKIFAAVALGLAGVTGITYAVTRKPKRSSSSRSRPRRREVIVTTPTHATPGALPGMRS